MESMTIGELARRSGVPATTLRYYDRFGLLVSERLPNNRRRYPAIALDLLQLIQLCRAMGCTLDEVSSVLTGDTEARREIALRRMADVDRYLAELTAAKAILSHFAECQHTPETAVECRMIVARTLRSVGAERSVATRAAVARQARQVSP